MDWTPAHGSRRLAVMTAAREAAALAFVQSWLATFGLDPVHPRGLVPLAVQAGLLAATGRRSSRHREVNRTLWRFRGLVWAGHLLRYERDTGAGPDASTWRLEPAANRTDRYRPAAGRG